MRLCVVGGMVRRCFGALGFKSFPVFAGGLVLRSASVGTECFAVLGLLLEGVAVSVGTEHRTLGIAPVVGTEPRSLGIAPAASSLLLEGVAVSVGTEHRTLGIAPAVGTELRSLGIAPAVTRIWPSCVYRTCLSLTSVRAECWVDGWG